MGDGLKSAVSAIMSARDCPPLNWVTDTCSVNFSPARSFAAAYLDMIRHVAALAHRDELAGRMTGYIESVVDNIRKKASDARRPLVYGVFGHPLFPLYAKKSVNELIEIAVDAVLTVSSTSKRVPTRNILSLMSTGSTRR
jgi:hypothetical protein